MRTLTEVAGWQLKAVVRSRWIVGYAVLLLGASLLLIQFGGSGARALLSLVNLVLVVVPLVSIMFGTLYVYQARQFIELILAQPVNRGAVYFGLLLGLAVPLMAVLLLGVGVPLGVRALREPGLAGPLAMLLAAGALLSIVFSAFALAVAVVIEDRARGLGAAILVWLLCTAVYDGLILLVLASFRDYPMETPVLVLTFLNPVDVARVLLLFALDAPALMGYTGAVYERALGGTVGRLAGFGALAVCAAVPLAVGYQRFRTKDF